jgi:hypothetical protein
MRMCMSASARVRMRDLCVCVCVCVCVCMCVCVCVCNMSVIGDRCLALLWTNSFASCFFYLFFTRKVLCFLYILGDRSFSSSGLSPPATFRVSDNTHRHTHKQRERERERERERASERERERRTHTDTHTLCV